MYLEIFDVEHGACTLITTSNGKRVMIDCGHNATTGWKPGTALLAGGVHRLDRLYITNYDEDHVSGYPNLHNSVSIGALIRNPSVQPATIRYLKSEDGMGVGIDRLVWSIENVFTGGAVPAFEDYGDTSFSVYWNQYGFLPTYFDDENNLSLVVFVTCGEHKFIFPGDMERAGWLQLLRNEAFVAELRSANVFVASHHGRENGYCEEIMKLCPGIRAVIISDKKMGYQSQETVDRYRKHAWGFNYNGEIRRVLTTRRDGYMCFSVPTIGMAQVSLGAAAA
jgi:beta-lactamase superfamily II metal-dependent hydrolase